MVRTNSMEDRYNFEKDTAKAFIVHHGGAVQARPRLESDCFQKFNLMKRNMPST